MAKVGGFYFERGNGDSPETFTRVCETKVIPQFGKTNSQADSSTFCSGGTREFVPGMADGTELSFTMNRDASSAVQQLLIDDVEDKLTGHYRIVEEIDGSPAYSWAFSAAALTWGIVPNLDQVNDFVFGCKISGNIAKSSV